ncbi:MAG: DEAD/DEAH box helicase family protein [Desulfovibrio sp.]|nr:DEAD/DEAH box helicase family protein [Desulfovibrio sp.]
MNSIDTNGKFSDLLAGTLDKSKAKGYADDDVESIVSWLATQNGDQVEFEDVQALYKGTAPMESIVDLAQFESVAITPDGMLEPYAKYCSGDVVSKMNGLRTAMCATDDEKIIAKFQQQIDTMNANIKRVPVENIVFGLQNKWFSRQYILDYLHENGYSEAVYGEMRDVEVEDYDGKMITRKEFVIDPDAVNGEFRINGVRGREPQGFVKQLEKYLNGGNITSSGKDAQENISQYKRDAKLLEFGFDSWMKQHPDSDDLAEDYSLRFNGYVPVEYDTGDLGIEDLISGEITPHTYQNAEVRRLSEQGSGICGFGTGLGKSFTALAMAAYNYKKGRAKRTCVVVPSAVLENWYHEARAFYNESYMRSNVLFVGLEPKVSKDGDIERRPILDVDGNPKTGKNGLPLMQDVVRFTRSKEDIFAALSKIPQSNYSLVVITKEKFQSIPVRPETMKAYTEDMVKRNLISDAQADKAHQNAAKKGGTSYAEDVRKNQLEGQFSNEGGAKKGELPYLEDMGFDSIITDESHFFKNSMKAQKTGGVVGVPSPDPSQIAVDMSIKCDWLRRNNNGRGVYGLTATPVTNSPIEIFNMLSLVAPKEDFEQMGIYTVDDFVRMFGEMEERDRINVANDVVQATTLVGFKNLDGLRNLFGKYVNIKTVQDVDGEIHVPNAFETQEEVPVTEKKKKIYALLRLEAKAAARDPDAKDQWEKLTGGQKPRSMFSIMRDMDRCTTDMDLYQRQMTFVFSNTHKAAMEKLLPTLPKSFTVEEKDEDTGEKIKVTYEYEPKIIDNGDTFSLIVHEQHEAAVLDAMRKESIAENEVNHPLTTKYAKLIENLKKHIEQNGKQIIFTEEKSQHQKLKRILVHNLPFEDQNFGIINAEDAAGDKLDKISKAYNSGIIRIVIANKKAEVGVNLQKGTTAIHHLTLPWTPASINQRNGRGVRQGNKVETVEIYYYHGKGTFDAYRKQLLESKANWIGQLLSGKESTAENADIAAQEEMNALMSGNIEEYRKKKAEAEEKRKNAAKSQLVNRLKMLASIQSNLATLEERREAARQKANAAVEEQELRIKRYEQGNKGEETVKKAKAELVKLQVKLATIDKKFDEEKTKSEAQRNMNSRMLREAAKKGELPFDESLIDHPETCLITLKGEIYKIGEFLEFPQNEDRYRYYSEPEGVYQIEQLDQESKELILRDLEGYGSLVRIKADKVSNKGKKVSYSESELAIKRLMSGNVKYQDLSSCGVTKEQFLENLDTLSLEVSWGAIMQKPSGEYLFVNSLHDIEDDLRFVWPEPENEDFRKKALLLWLHEEREGGYNDSSDLMRKFFGNDFATLALEYGRKASPVEINTVIRTAWDNFWNRAADNPVYKIKLQAGETAWISNALLQSAMDIFSNNGYDNKQDMEQAVNDFAAAKATELRRVADDAKKAAEEQAQAKLRESKNYKEIPGDIDTKFKELGMTICYNTQDTRLKMKAGTQNLPAFTRIFVQDSAGIGGKLFRAKEDIKRSFKAEYTTQWKERFGSWWHMGADIDLNSLYDAIAG